MNRHDLERRRTSRRQLSVLAGLLIVVTSGLAAVSIGTAATVAVPAVTSPPTISGTAKVDSTLTANNGSWSGGGNMTFAYQWLRCDKDGGSCSNISGATQKTYVLKTVDKDNTLRVRVTASNGDGSTPATTVPTGVVLAADVTPPPPAANGCPKPAQTGEAVNVTEVVPPARLQVAGFASNPGMIPGSFRSFTMRVSVTDTCGQPVRGANVYATAVPFNQVTIPRAQTGNDGSVELTFQRTRGFPAARQQRLMVIFVRATKPGENILAGVSTRRLISLPVNLRG